MCIICDPFDFLFTLYLFIVDPCSMEARVVDVRLPQSVDPHESSHLNRHHVLSCCRALAPYPKTQRGLRLTNKSRTVVPKPFLWLDTIDPCLVSTVTSHLAGREAKLCGKEVHEVIIAQAGRGQTLLPLSVRGSGTVLGYLKSLIQFYYFYKKIPFVPT